MNKENRFSNNLSDISSASESDCSDFFDDDLDSGLKMKKGEEEEEEEDNLSEKTDVDCDNDGVKESVSNASISDIVFSVENINDCNIGEFNSYNTEIIKLRTCYEDYEDDDNEENDDHGGGRKNAIGRGSNQRDQSGNSALTGKGESARLNADVRGRRKQEYRNLNNLEMYDDEEEEEEEEEDEKEEEEEVPILDDSDNGEELLPDGWRKVVHISGIPIYHNVKANVVTLARPYQLGIQPFKSHLIDKSTIPCWKYVDRKKYAVDEKNNGKGASLTDEYDTTIRLCPIKIENDSERCIHPKFDTVRESKGTGALLREETDYAISEETMEESFSAATAMSGDNYADAVKVESGLEENAKSPVEETNEFTTTKIALYTEPSIGTGDDETNRDEEMKVSSLENDLQNGEPERAVEAVPIAFDETAANDNSRDEIKSLSTVNEQPDGSCNNADNNDATLNNRMEDRERLLQIRRDRNKEVFQYYEHLFIFDRLKYMKFKSWEVRRMYARSLRHERSKNLHRPGTFILSVPIYKYDRATREIKTDFWNVNPKEKSFVGILCEYLQQTLKTHPSYKFEELDNAKTPYSATIVIKGTEYGTGVGKSKKEAKILAARNTMEVLLPTYKEAIDVAFKLSKHSPTNDEPISTATTANLIDDNIIRVFDTIAITDPQVTQFAFHMSAPTPYELLTNYVSRKYPHESVTIECRMIDLNKCTMSIKEHVVTVSCGKKREANQVAAQAMLQQLHPYIVNYGSLLRLYGSISSNYKQTAAIRKNDENDNDTNSNVSSNKMQHNIVDNYSDCNTDKGPDAELLNALRIRMTALSGKATLELHQRYDCSGSSATNDSEASAKSSQLADFSNGTGAELMTCSADKTE